MQVWPLVFLVTILASAQVLLALRSMIHSERESHELRGLLERVIEKSLYGRDVATLHHRERSQIEELLKDAESSDAEPLKGPEEMVYGE